MNFAILRTAKLKTLGNIGASAKHTFREIETPNANSEKTHENVHHGAQNSEQVVDAVKARLPEKVRSNAVLAIEYLITASPEFFARNSQAVERDYFKRAEQWLREKHGSENVVYCGIQKDESTPHMVAYVVPIDEKGKLNARKFLGGRDKLRAMQTDFAQQVGADFKLERGVEGSKLKHERVKRNYALIKHFDVENSALDFKWSMGERADIMRGNLPERLRDYITTADVFRTEKQRIEKNMQMMSNQTLSQKKELDEVKKQSAEMIEKHRQKVIDVVNENTALMDKIKMTENKGMTTARWNHDLMRENKEQQRLIEQLQAKLRELMPEPENAPEQPTTRQNDLDRGKDAELNKSRLSPDFEL